MHLPAAACNGVIVIGIEKAIIQRIYQHGGHAPAEAAKCGGHKQAHWKEASKLVLGGHKNQNYGERAAAWRTEHDEDQWIRVATAREHEISRRCDLNAS